MNNFLAKLKPDTKVTVGISVSPNVGLELIQIDPSTNKIMKYARRDLPYNPSIREIEDYSEFKQNLIDLFNEVKIQPQTAKAVLNMPSVCFGHDFLPTVLDDEGVTTALISKIEENYLFKKNTPVVSWVDVKENNRTEKRCVLYAAMQEEVLNVIQQVFTDLGVTLIAVENTYSSIIKTLQYTEITKDFAESNGSWNILLVSQNNYAVFSMLGYSVIEYFEEPLAIKSFNNDEVYVAISQSASAVLDKFPTDKLLIVSESNDVSAEILAMQLNQPGEVKYLECNQYAKDNILTVDLNILPHYVKAITPEAIGAAIYSYKDFGIKLNFLQKSDYKAPDMIRIGNFDLTQSQLMTYVGLICAAILLVCFGASKATEAYLAGLQSQNSELDSQQKTLDAELQELQKKKTGMDIYTAAKKIDSSMQAKVKYYYAIGADIPAQVWLTSFYADSRGAYGIKGETTAVDDVYLFFRNIKSQVPESDLILSSLSVDDNEGLVDIDVAKDLIYSFELTNASFGGVKQSDPNEEALKQAEADKKDGKNKNRNSKVPDLPTNLPST